jgi:hypothetical protein
MGPPFFAYDHVEFFAEYVPRGRASALRCGPECRGMVQRNGPAQFNGARAHKACEGKVISTPEDRHVMASRGGHLDPSFLLSSSLDNIVTCNDRRERLCAIS